MLSGLSRLTGRAVSGAICTALLLAVCSASLADAGRPWHINRPKNIIVMISDGCGYNHIDATNLYQYGRLHMQAYERFPYRVGMSHFGATGSYDPALAWSNFDYVKINPTDSANAATAMSTGIKTNNGMVCVDPAGNRLENIMQRAESMGKSTGVVTTVQFSHATPAGFVAHNASRNNYADIANEMLLSSGTDVIIGCGNPGFDDNGLPATKDAKYVGGASTWNALLAGTAGGDANGDGLADPWKLIQTRAQFQALARGKAPKRLCGVAQAYSTTQQSRAGNGNAAPYVVPLTATVPTLAEMSRAALNVLDSNKDGFALMIEGGAIDWAGHANQAGRLIEEEMDFNQSVDAVIEWVNRHSNWVDTLLVVTGDHETGYLTGSGSGLPATWNPLVNNGAGVMPGLQWNSGDHTNSLIPLYARGFGAELFGLAARRVDPVRGRYLDNTDVAKVCFKVLSFDQHFCRSGK